MNHFDTQSQTPDRRDTVPCVVRCACGSVIGTLFRICSRSAIGSPAIFRYIAVFSNGDSCSHTAANSQKALDYSAPVLNQQRYMYMFGGTVAPRCLTLHFWQPVTGFANRTFRHYDISQGYPFDMSLHMSFVGGTRVGSSPEPGRASLKLIATAVNSSSR